MAAESNPFAALPPPVADAVLSRLRRTDLASASLACSAWRDLPYQHGLPEPLVIQSASTVAAGILAAHGGLRRCSNVRAIRVSSSTDALWPPLADSLCQHRLPALRELHIQHSSQTDAAQLQQLRSILQVQGPGCALHLALTDKASVQALLPLLPIQGLASLDVNVPFLGDGLDALLLRAATIQASALRGDSSQHQQRLRVGVWVCAWGGCPGLALQDALRLHSRLQQVPGCVMTGCEAVTVATAADVVALQRLAGLEALGIAFVGQQQQQDAVAAAEDEDASGSMAASLAATLRAAGSRLGQLNLRGSPTTGWGLASGLAHHPLAGLTSGITKLSLLKDFSVQPLPLQPLASLALLQELALERVQLGSRNELTCLGALTALRVLSLVLTVQADELLESQGPSPQPWDVTDSLGQLALSSGGACWCCRRVVDAQTTAADLHAQVCACACGGLGATTSPALIEWAWMRQLSRLETAWLQVPHIDLSCLPPSLVELDAQQPHDVAVCSITCDARDVCLPNLRLLVLPRPLVQVGPAGAGGGDSDDSDGDSDSDEALAVRRHHEAGLLLAIVLGCPRVRDLELVQWAPPPAALLAGARELAHLRRLTCCTADDGSPDEVVRQCAAAREALRLRPCEMAVQEQLLVLSSFPWHRVLSARCLTQNADWKTCCSGSAAFELQGVELAPSTTIPPGGRLSMLISAFNKLPQVTAGQATVKVYYYGWPVLSASDSMCGAPAAPAAPGVAAAHRRALASNSGGGGWSLSSWSTSMRVAQQRQQQQEQLRHSVGDGATCTLPGGQLQLHHDAKLPAIAPRGSYSMRLEASDIATGQQLFCVDVWFRVG